MKRPVGEGMRDSESETMAAAGATPRQVLRMLQGLLDDGHLAGLEQLPRLAAEHGISAGLEGWPSTWPTCASRHCVS